MRLSGVLPEDDDGSTDLATLEKRLADRATSRSAEDDGPTPVDRVTEQRRASSVHPTQKNTATPVQPGLPSPRSGTTSPEPQRQAATSKEEDTLAEMMCSLVTNNYGETRYIGGFLDLVRSKHTLIHGSRFLFWFFNLLPKRHPMGQRQDRRRIISRDDIDSCH